MRWRRLLLISLGLNLALAFVVFISGPRRAPKLVADFPNLGPIRSTNLVKTNIVVRRQFFSWREVESPDYPTYIANLRDIGCPESTIRDIIVADVNQLYALKRATEVVTAEQQWWRSEPSAEIVKTAEDKLRALDDERRALLTRLLGPHWEMTEPDLLALRARQGIALDGPVLGLLPADVKQAVREVATRQQQKTLDCIEAARKEGKTPDPVELAGIRQETRDALAKILSPPQLEEFLLRYSENAQSLRTELSQLKFFDATPDEFRSLFRAIDQFDQQIQLNFSGDDPNSVQQRATLERQREDAIKDALGEKRYALYQRLQDPLYRDAYAAAMAAGSAQSTEALYAIAQATANERSRIQADTSLTPLQKEIKFKEMELEQAKATAAALGQKLPAEPALPPPLPPIVHVIQPGETMDMLSRQFGVSIRDIISANPNRDPATLRPGSSINVPASLPAQR